MAVDDPLDVMGVCTCRRYIDSKYMARRRYIRLAQVSLISCFITTFVRAAYALCGGYGAWKTT